MCVAMFPSRAGVGPPIRRIALMPVTLSTSSSAACIVDGRELMALKMDQYEDRGMEINIHSWMH